MTDDGGRDPDLIVTPEQLRHAVCAALEERAEIGDTLARGALRVIAALAAGDRSVGRGNPLTCPESSPLNWGAALCEHEAATR